ncbi:MAG: addiction module protein [Bacteroidia bacterium]
MTAVALRKKAHQYLDSVDDAMLKSVFALLKEYKKNHGESILSDEQKAELDRRMQLHKAGKSKSYTWHESKAIITAKLKRS